MFLTDWYNRKSKGRDQMSYTHLQIQSGYSLMNSTITIDKLVKRATELKLDALALTDVHVLYGIIPFYQACKKQGIKPIIGMTLHLENGFCVLLAKNNNGYQQLIKLSTKIQECEWPSIGIEELAGLTTDLICIFPANNRDLEMLLLSETHDKVATYLSKWQALFAHGDFYLGIQEHGLKNERSIHNPLKAFHEQSQIPVAAINDVRYLDEKDVVAYDCLQAMRKGKQWGYQIDHRMGHHHLRSLEEMDILFASWPEVLEETVAIESKCQVIIDFDQQMLPSFPVPNQMSAHDYLEKLCWQQVKVKYPEITKEIAGRLSYELSTIQSMQFSDYFLIVADFIAYAKENKISVGPGRGSSAGSIVAFVLNITEVDPIQYDLLFERFLNPERLTMPDIDVDFSDRRRDEVIQYVQNKYGIEHVAQIVTFGTFAARSLIRELIKTLGIDQQDADFILREVPVQTKQNIVGLVRASTNLQQYIKQSDSLKTLFTIAAKLEGIPRHVSTHAAGIVICKEKLIKHVPLTIGANDTHLTQYQMNGLEALGLLKIDLLGLRNLTLLESVIQSITFTANKTIDLQNIPENDARTYELLQKGRTNGVFQLESQGMKQVLIKLKPTSFEDLVAVNALFRPGPMDFIPTYIARKHLREKVTFPHPDLAPILEKTFGVLVYQEQIMQIAHRIAGFSLGNADILRRAVSKKQVELMDEQKEAFINGCKDNGYNQTVAEELFSWIVKFSAYGFPRSHAVAYSKVSYQLAFLKANYPANFFAELLSSVVNQQEKVYLYIKELKDLNHHILPPSVNHSRGKYTVEKNNVRIGLLAIKGIGSQVVNEIIRVRKNGLFRNLFDFCLRVSFRIINRKTIENLIMVGAFDSLYPNRASLLASLDQAMEQGELFREFSDQAALFQEKIELEVNYEAIEDFSVVRKLADEKELLGIYVSSHPLKEYRDKLRANGFVSLKNAQSHIGKKQMKSAAIIQSLKKIRTRRGDTMAFLTLSDEAEDMEAVVFPDLYRNVSRWLEEEMVVQFTGNITSRSNRVQWVLSEIIPFDPHAQSEKQTARLFVKLTDQDKEDALHILKETADRHPGSTAIIIYDPNKKQTYQLTNNYFLHPNPDCLKHLKQYFGKENVVLQKIQT
jgi:DNA polymerase-3 subunit alpha